MPDNNRSPETTGEQQRGRPFQKGQSGNPAGRPIGARHRATMAAQALLDGEAEALTRKAVELALIGDLTALKLCLERIVPTRKDAPVIIELPSMTTAADIVKVQATLLQAIGNGDMTPQEGAALCAVAENVRRSIETQELEVRIAKIEQAQEPSK